MFYIVLIIFHFSFLLVNCENVSVAMSAAEMMPKISIESMSDQIGETTVKLDAKQLFRQARFMSSLGGVFNGVRFLVKSFVHSYNWYSPELELGKCVYKYTRTLYPEFMQMRLSYETVTKYLQTLLFAIYGYITEMINENRQDIQSEQQRIGVKVAEMTLHDVSSPFLPSQRPSAAAATTTTTALSTAAATSSSTISSPRPINHVASSFYNYNDGNFNYMENIPPFHPNRRSANHHHSNRKFGSGQNIYENDLVEVASSQSFNDFSPRTRNADILQFDKNINFLPGPITNEYDASKSFSLETDVPFDMEKLETKHLQNYNVPAADLPSSSSSAIPSSSLTTTTTTPPPAAAANRFDLPDDTDTNGKFSMALPALENNLNVGKSRKPNKFSVMYVGPRQFSTDYQDDVSPSSEDDVPTLELNKNSNGNDDGKGAAGDDDSNIFDLENVILESFGFNAKAVKSSTLVLCVRSYAINLFRRTFEYFILM